jgi:hypothetical protein
MQIWTLKQNGQIQYKFFLKKMSQDDFNQLVTSLFYKEFNSLTHTNIDTLVSNYNLLTIIKQFTTHNDTLFNHIRYLNDQI